MFQENCYDRDLDVNTNFYADNMTNNIDVDVDVNGMNSNMNMNTCPNNPIIEPMRERCINRTIVHQVPHVCPFMYNLASPPKKVLITIKSRPEKVLLYSFKYDIFFIGGYL